MSYFDDYIADGLCCATCGAFIDGGEPGFARYCGAPACAPEGVAQPHIKRGPAGKPKPCQCGTCGKQFKSKGARKNHRRRAHPVGEAA